MATDKYGFENVSIGTTGWNGIIDNNTDDFDLHLHTRILVTLEQSVGVGQTVCLGPGGKGRLARRGSDSDRKPALGVAIEGGLVDDEIRVQRVGPFTSGVYSFTKIGRPVYLGDTQGSLTQTRPADDIQFIGIATATTTILLGGNVMVEDYQAPSTTTTTTSTTTTVTTTTTT
jgi:hypothetical protein